MMYDLCIIVVNYINYWDTLRLFQELVEQREVSCKYYIIDNHSPNNSVNKLKASIQLKPVIISNKKNVGYARAINQGLKLAINEEITYTIVINNDIFLPNKMFLKNMIEVAVLNPNYGVLCPLIYDQNGRLTKIFQNRSTLIDIFFGELLSWREFRRKNSYFENSSGLIPVYRISGSCMLLNNNLIRKVGLFDENTFLYGEEEILAERFKFRGYLAGINCNEKVIHHHSTSVNLSMKQIKKAFLLSKSKKHYLESYRGCNKFLSNIIMIGFYVSTLIRLAVTNFRK